MTIDQQRLDGNAAGGVLGQIFAFEMTTAEVICANTPGRSGTLIRTWVSMGSLLTVGDRCGLACPREVSER